MLVRRGRFLIARFWSCGKILVQTTNRCRCWRVEIWNRKLIPNAQSPCCEHFNWCGASLFYCAIWWASTELLFHAATGKGWKWNQVTANAQLKKCRQRKFSFEMKRSNNHRTASLANLMTHQAQILFLDRRKSIFLFSRCCWRRKLLLPTECDQAAPGKVTIGIMWHEKDKQEDRPRRSDGNKKTVHGGSMYSVCDSY